VPIILWVERKLLGRFQARIGPNRVGPYGLMQPRADVLKLLSKEQSTPSTAVPWMMALAPVISIFTAVASLAIIPFGPVGAWGGEFGLYGIDVSIGVLWPLAFGALAFYGLMLGGWASGSKYSFLGAMRFGSFFMAEYINVVVISGIAVTMFLGGWHGPGPTALAPLWVLVKMAIFVILFIWIRATLPRLRYDQLMAFGWKVLLPLATLN